MAAVELQHVAKVYPDGSRAVDDLTLEIRDGEFVVWASRRSTSHTIRSRR